VIFTLERKYAQKRVRPQCNEKEGQRSDRLRAQVETFTTNASEMSTIKMLIMAFQNVYYVSLLKLGNKVSQALELAEKELYVVASRYVRNSISSASIYIAIKSL
jgi:hypothetical protein